MNVIAVKLWNFTFNAICFILCSFQLLNIAFCFFEYPIVTHLKYSLPKYVSTPDVHMCVVITDLAEMRTKLKDMNPKAKSTKERTWEFYYLFYDTFTIADLLNFTPNITVEKCIHRHNFGNVVNIGNKTSCSKIFSIQKYVFQQYICYRIKDVRNNMYRALLIAESFYYEQLLMESYLPKILREVEKVRVSLTTAFLPFIGRNYPYVIYKRPGSITKLQVSCQNNTMKYLGYPYDNFICSSNVSDYYDCMERCKESKSLAMLSMLPRTSFFTRPRNFKTVSNFVNWNRSSDEIMENIHDECDGSCIKRKCHFSYCLTRGKSDFPSLDLSVQSSIRVNLPDQPDMVIDEVPEIKLLDCIIFVLSTLGTWFGLVIISCNPLKLYRNFRQGFRPEPNNVIAIRHVNVTRINNLQTST